MPDPAYFLRVERVVYRHHRLAGLLIVLGAAAIFLRWDLHPHWFAASRIATWLLRLLLAGATLVGVVLVFRPSALKPLEGIANLWIDLAQQLDRHSRIAICGLLVLIFLAGMAIGAAFTAARMSH